METANTYTVGRDWTVMSLLKKKSGKIRVLLVDEMNDLQSQIAEYFLKDMYGDLYEVQSAGPKSDYIDCELISVMYQNGYDIRRWSSKPFNRKDIMQKIDYLVFMEKATYDRIKDDVPWEGPQLLKDFGRRENFESATDDKELYDCYVKLIESVKEWVAETFRDPEKLPEMVVNIVKWK